ADAELRDAELAVGTHRVRRPDAGRVAEARAVAQACAIAALHAMDARQLDLHLLAAQQLLLALDHHLLALQPLLLHATLAVATRTDRAGLGIDANADGHGGRGPSRGSGAARHPCRRLLTGT